MKIQQITLNNIGPYIGENAFSFNTGDVSKNIILIGGRNGAGKTTLFDAMKICLYGYKLFGYRQNSQSYTAKIKRLMNDSAKRTQTPIARVALSVFIDDGYTNNAFMISRIWSLQNNQIKEIYKVYKDGNLLSDDEQVDFDNYLLQTIPPALFNFHFFNGESVSDVLLDKEKGQSFRKAFTQICGLDTLELIQEQLQSNIRTLCIILDLFSRKAIAHRVSNKGSTLLITKTFRSAYAARQPKRGLVFHSDRGIQYVSSAFQKLLIECGVAQSLSRSGQPNDNAVCESFFSYMKKEELYRRQYKSEKELLRGVDTYIDFYNKKARQRAATLRQLRVVLLKLLCTALISLLLN